MNWYIAKIIFEISVGIKDLNQFDEQFRLIQASNQEEAFLKARMIGVSEEESFMNDNKHLVKWEFINVELILPIHQLDDGVEVYSRIYEIEDGKRHVNNIHLKAVSLRLTSTSIASMGNKD